MRGVLFFVAVDSFMAGLDFTARTPHVTIDLTGAPMWDCSAAGAVDNLAAYDKPGGSAAGH